MDNDFIDFSDFMGSVNQETLLTNDPKVRAYSDRVNWLGQAVKQAKPKKDVKSRYRIIKTPSPGIFARKLKLHYRVGIAQGSCSCSIMKGEECKICVRAQELYALKLRDLAYGISGKSYHGLWIIDRNEPQAGPQYWIVPDTTIVSIWELIKHPTNGSILGIDDLFAGYDLFFCKRKESPAKPFETICDLKLDPDASPLSRARNMEELRGDADAIKWLSFVKAHTPIDADLIFLSQADQEKALVSTYGDDEDGPDDFAAPAQPERSPWDNVQPQAQPYQQPAPVQPYAAAPAPVQAPEPQMQPQPPVQVTPQAPVVSLTPEVPQTVAQLAPAPAPAPPAGMMDMKALQDLLATRPQ